MFWKLYSNNCQNKGHYYDIIMERIASLSGEFLALYYICTKVRWIIFSNYNTNYP